MNTIVQYLELAALILTIAGGLGGIVASVWGYIDHGHPDARREWLLRAVQLALAARGLVEQALGPTAQVLEVKDLKTLCGDAENYLATHGLHVHLDENTLKLILAELRGKTSPAASTP